MKKLIIVLLSVWINNGNPQDLNNPIIISPLIGHRLDPEEREFYNLIENINGFIQAEFFLNQDSSINISVKYKDESIKDTLIETHWTPDDMRKYLLTSLLRHINEEDIHEVRIIMNENTVKTGYFYSVNESSVNLFDRFSRELTTISSNHIAEIEIESDASLLPYAAGGTCIGGLAGGLIGRGAAESDDDESEKFFLNIDEKLTSCLGGLAIGALGGLVVGSVIGSQATVTDSYGPDSKGSFFYLNGFAMVPMRHYN